jgi:hypothetical protein
MVSETGRNHTSEAFSTGELDKSGDGSKRNCVPLMSTIEQVKFNTVPRNTACNQPVQSLIRKYNQTSNTLQPS